MRLIGALAFGVCFFFGAGLVMGKTPRLYFGLGKSKPKADVSTRQLWLTQAGLDLTPFQYYAGLWAFGIIVFAIVSAITATPIVALAPALLAGALPHVFFGRKRDQNMAKTTKAWPDAIREIIASIESNASLHGAITQLAYKGPEGLREAFERFPTLSTTVGVVPALEAVRERLGDPTSDRVIEILILAHERGGSVITEILRDLAHATTEDLQLVEEIETSQLEQKINSRAVFALPWLVLIMLVMSNKNFYRFYHTGAGYLTVAGGALLSALGMLIMAKLSKSQPEPRVFGGSAVSRRDAGAEEAAAAEANA